MLEPTPMTLIAPAPAALEELPEFPQPPSDFGADSPLDPDDAPALIPLARAAPAFEDAPPDMAEVAITAPWPSNVPGREAAERTLRAVLVGRSPEMLSQVAPTRRVMAHLSPLERSALRDEIASPEASRVFLRAAATRWRLTLAHDLRPPPAEPTNGEALDALAREVDEVLSQLSTLRDFTSSPAAELSITQIRTALANGGASLTTRPAAPPPAPTALRKPRSQPKVKLEDKAPAMIAAPWEPSRSARMGMASATAFLALVAIGWMVRTAPPPSLSRLPGAPDDVVGMDNPETGVILAQSKDGTEPSLAFRRYLDEKARDGWTVIERYPAGHGNFMLVHAH